MADRDVPSGGIAPRGPGAAGPELVTASLAWPVAVREFGALVSALWDGLGPAPLVETEVFDVGRDGAFETTATRPSRADAIALVHRVAVEFAALDGYVQLRVTGDAGSLFLCNDLDLHVRAATPALLDAARRHFAARGLPWFEDGVRRTS